VLRRPGRPLDAAARAFFEPRFGQDFSRVRVHTDALAAESARALDALAYVVGRHVVFGAGQYAPRGGTGQRLLAHELAHVVQQQFRDTAPGAPLTVGPAGGPQEQEAERAADRLVTGGGLAGGLTVAPLSAQRVCGPAAIGSRTACTGLSGPVTGERFLFKFNCDDLSRGEEARLRAFAATVSGGDLLSVHGFASIEGDRTYNANLSCARAQRAALVLESAGVPNRQLSGLFMHGATAGVKVEQRSVIIDKNAPPPPAPSPPACKAAPNPDHFGRADNPTTDGEAAVVLKNPVDAFTADSVRDEATLAAGRSGLPGAFLGPRDSFRHCFASCRLTQEIGASQAEKFGTAHENSNPSTVPFDNEQDLHDNFMGRSFGAPGANCRDACLTALRAGQLRTVRGPDANASARREGLPAGPVTTPCLGASDQPWP
jgi:outer membrane protein OmpA-like peptidoglycan-associated protein